MKVGEYFGKIELSIRNWILFEIRNPVYPSSASGNGGNLIQLYPIEMKTILKHLGRPTAGFSVKKITARLERILSRRRIDEARVTIGNHPECSPPFVVAMHLVTPGPDLFAQARDHTPEAAMRKAVSKIEEDILQREMKRETRGKSRISLRRPMHSPN
jgi:ribosome-associated translation inhibitor RaiA